MSKRYKLFLMISMLFFSVEVNANCTYEIIPNGIGECNAQLFKLSCSGTPVNSTAEWNFGDGSPSVTLTSDASNNFLDDVVPHLYSSSGNYTISCTLNINGSTQILQIVDVPVVAASPPQIYQTATGMNNDCELSSHFRLACIPNLSDVVDVTWDFVDPNDPALLTVTSQFSDDVSHQYSSVGNYSVSATVNYNNLPPLTVNISPSYYYPYNTNDLSTYSISMQMNSMNSSGFTEFVYDGDDIPSNLGLSLMYTIDFGDNSAPFSSGQLSSLTQGLLTTHTYPMPFSGVAVLNVYFVAGENTCNRNFQTPIFELDPDPCCSNFAPIENRPYWVSAWVKEDHASQQKTYTSASIELEFVGLNPAVFSFVPTGEIIDGWQRIVGKFIVPDGSTDLKLHLVNDDSSVDVYFDDVRVHPFNASMKSYVYDPETLWLTAELDDNNYATFYEYDNEGQLIRIKKETARGVMTIQESRSSNPKKEFE